MSDPAPLPLRRLLITVAVLYAVQGLPAGIVWELGPTFLKDHGVSNTEVGVITGLVGMPYAWKALWSPLVDRYGRARTWITSCLLVLAVGTAALPFVGTGVAFTALLLGVGIASATQDVAIDGYTTTITPEEHHGRVNGYRVGAYRIAMVASGGGALVLAGVAGWPVAFGAVALVAAAMTALTFRLPDVPAAPQALGDWVADFVAWLTRDGWLATLGLLGFVLLFKLGDAAMAPMIKTFWLDMGDVLSDPKVEFGLVSVTVGAWVAAGGALVGGEIASRIGLFRAVWALGAVQAVSNLGYTYAAYVPSRAAIYSASVFESFSSGLGVAAYLAVFMRLCEGRQAAARFAVLTAAAMLTKSLASMVSGIGVDEVGYGAYFAVTFFAALPAFAFVPLVRGRILRQAPARVEAG